MEINWDKLIKELIEQNNLIALCTTQWFPKERVNNLEKLKQLNAQTPRTYPDGNNQRPS